METLILSLPVLQNARIKRLSTFFSENLILVLTLKLTQTVERG